MMLSPSDNLYHHWYFEDVSVHGLTNDPQKDYWKCILFPVIGLITVMYTKTEVYTHSKSKRYPIWMS